MTVLQRIQREPAAALAFATAVLTVLTGLDVLTVTGATVALGVVTAAIGLLRYVTVPAAEVLAQAKPAGDTVQVVAGAAASIPTGEPVDVVVRRAPPTTQA